MKIIGPKYNANPEIKNIIFDWGDVITDLRFDLLAESLGELGCDDLDMLHHLAWESVFKPFETGSIPPGEFRTLLRKHLRQGVSDREIDHAWNTILGDLPASRWHLLEQLQPSYRLFLLSNTNVIHRDYYFEYIFRKFGIYGYTHLFEKVYFSFELGMRKPDREIFQYVLVHNGLHAAETLFIDDLEQNTDAAAGLGMQTCQLKAPQTLEALFD